jgi:hypothetical protein
MVEESWFMDTSVADKPRFKFVTKTDSMDNDVMEVFGGKVYTYHIADKARMIAKATAEKVTPEQLKIIEDMVVVKTGCEIEVLSNFTMTADSLRAKKINENMQTPRCQFEDGSAEYAADGYWTLVAANGDVKELGEIDIDGKLEGTTTKVLSIVEASADVFEGCTLKPSTRALEEYHEKQNRALGIQEWASNTDWCGAGTDNCITPCPGTGRGNFEDNMGCRRHDHGAKHEPAAGGLGVKLECQVDKDLADYTNNWAAIAIFGSGGIAMTWGCSNYANVQNCWWHWAGCGWRGCPGWQRRCSSSWQWETKFGPWRYSNINNRGADQIYAAKCKTCTGDIW